MTTQYRFDDCPDRADTDSVKYDLYASRDILPMWVADMDFAVAPPITAALQQRLNHPLYGYTHVSESLNNLVAERVQQRYGWRIETGWLVWIPGVVAGVNLACRSYGDSNTTVYSPNVVYPYIPEAPLNNNRLLRKVPMVLKNNRWVMDTDWLAAQADGANAMLLLCNPHNPGGSVYSREELQRLAEIAKANDMVVVSDEVHCDLILEPGLEHIPLASLDNSTAQRSITLMAASKTFNLAGLGCSFAIIPDPKLRRNFVQACKGLVSHVNLFGYLSTEAAFGQAGEWHRQLLDYLRNNRDFLMKEINAIHGLKLDPVEATYLAWIDVSGLGLEDPHAFFEQAGVGMSPGREFGDNGFMRLNFGCSRTTLEEAVSRIRSAVEQHWNGNHV